MNDSRTTRSSTGMVHHPEARILDDYNRTEGGEGQSSPMSLIGNTDASVKVSGDPVELKSADDSNVVFRTVAGTGTDAPKVEVSVYYV